MSDTSVSPTPSQENRSNTMHDALDSLMSVQEQSYDEFMNGFTYLTKEDINKQLLMKREKFLKKNEDCQGAQLQSKEETTADYKSDTGHSEEIELEVEVLEAGTRSNFMNKQPAAETVTVKFDNFVEAEDDDDDLESEESGYVASFGQREVNSLETNIVFSGEISKAVLQQPVNLKCDNDSLIPESCFDKSRNRDSAVSLTNENRMEGSIINPGEVDDDQELPDHVSINDRKLDFAASYRIVPPNENDQDVDQDADQVCSDEVEAFFLDENFDYDNVVLTPKFSSDVIEQMRSFSENNRNTDN